MLLSPFAACRPRILLHLHDFSSERTQRHLQKILLKTVLRVATKYCTQTMANAFPPNLMTPLLQMSLAPDASMRLLVHSILHTLIDRHSNVTKLTAVT